MKSTPEGDVMTTAAASHGVFTLGQWTGAGLSRSTLQRRVHSGIVVRLLPNVYAATPTVDTYQRRVVAAVLACPDVSAASHVTAAFLWGMVGFRGRTPYDIEIVTRRWRRVHRNVTVHESTDLTESDVTLRDGIPITTPARTLIDLGASAKTLVGPAIDTAIRNELTTLEEILVCLQRVARRGRNGVGIIRPHLAERISVSRLTESYLETLFFRGLEHRSVPLPEAQVAVLRDDMGVICRLDFAYPGRLGVALDGFEFHNTKERFRVDRAQQNELELAGWMVLRYTWWDITGGMDRTAAQVMRALHQRSPAEIA